jgi:hypothetical protein
LVVQGYESASLEFLHADGTRYGSSRVSAAASDVFVKVFRALQGQGFRDGEIRRALRSPLVRAESEFEKILRSALFVLTPARI